MIVGSGLVFLQMLYKIQLFIKTFVVILGNNELLDLVYSGNFRF